MASGSGIYFDGQTSARHAVGVELGADDLKIVAAGGRLLAVWPYDRLESHSTAQQTLKLGCRDEPLPARLDIADAALAEEIDRRAHGIDRSGSLQGRQRKRVVLWSIGAVASLGLFAWFGVPALAERLAPLIPHALEQKFGDAVNAQVLDMLDTRGLGERFACGNAASEKAGRAAIDKLMARLTQAANLPYALRATVVRRAEANAIALPGTQIYVFEGLIAKALNADEIAGVISHEIGHIVHRDGTKSLLQSAGLSLLFGMLLGDFVGGGAVVLAARSALQSSYSREAETAADLFGAQLMIKAGGDARALGTILTRIGGATEPGMKILLDHPETRTRVEAINRIAPARASGALLDAAELAALKRICSGR